MDEGGAYDDAAAKVLCDEEGPFWYLHAFVVVGIDWEDSACHVVVSAGSGIVWKLEVLRTEQ